MASVPPFAPPDRSAPARDAEPRFRTIFEHAPIGVARVLLDGTIADANASLAAFLGRRAGELIGRDIADLTHPDDVAIGAAAMGRLCRGEIDDFVMEKRYLRPDGVAVWAQVGVSLVRDADGNPLESIGAIVDIDHRKRTEEALRELQLRQQALLMNVPDAVWLKGVDGRYVAVNEAFARYVGRTPAQVTGMLQSELLPPDAAARAAELDARALVEGRVQVEDRVVVADGVERVFETVRTRFADGAGRWAGVVGVAHEITERIRSEAALRDSQTRLHQAQRIEAVGRLAGGIAHDYNNLLTAITSYADVVLQEIGPDSSVAGDVREISDAASRAASLTRQLLAFSRQQVMRREPLDVAGVVAGFRSMLARVLGEDVELETRLDDAPAVVRADRAQLEQVLLNLVINARDAMPRGGTLTIGVQRAVLDADFVAAHPGSREGRYVALWVRDSGVGMSPDVVAQAFEPFFTTKPLGAGVGLGLSTVYGIVKQLDGYIELTSQVDAGTTATIWLPAIAAPVFAPPAPAAGRADSGSETILLVEDEPAVRAVAARVLRRSGYTVLEASDGERAIAVARAHAAGIHLVLTDVVMPRMSGRELVDRLREQGITPLVLFMSGYTEDAIIRHGEFPAGTSFIEKPFTVQALLDRVRTALDAAISAA